MIHSDASNKLILSTISEATEVSDDTSEGGITEGRV